jgi:hypothetical protein
MSEARAPFPWFGGKRRKTWTEHSWKGARGYAAEGNDNRDKERIWFSPHCLGVGRQHELFPEMRVG